MPRGQEITTEQAYGILMHAARHSQAKAAAHFKISKWTVHSLTSKYPDLWDDVKKKVRVSLETEALAMASIGFKELIRRLAFDAKARKEIKTRELLDIVKACLTQFDELAKTEILPKEQALQAFLEAVRAGRTDAVETLRDAVLKLTDEEIDEILANASGETDSRSAEPSGPGD